jgi:uncharacterized membrane protein YoaK (UPF0700 family)
MFLTMAAAAPNLGQSKWQVICLALIAGYVDGYALRLLNTYVSFMSGNTTFAGVNIGQSHLAAAVPAILAIAAFVGGSFIGNWLSHSKLRAFRALIFTTAALLLALFVALNLHHPASQNLAIPILSLSMGLINPTVARIGAEPISVTFVTGTLNKIGSHLALATHRIPPTDAQSPQDTHLRRAILEATVWAAFFLGAILSAALHLGVLQLLPASTLLILFAILSISQVSSKAHTRSQPR